MKTLFFISILLSGVLTATNAQTQVLGTTAVKVAIGYSPIITNAVEIARYEATWILGTSFMFDNDQTLTKVSTEDGDFAVFTIGNGAECYLAIDGIIAGNLVHSEEMGDSQYLLVFDTEELGYVAIVVWFI